MPTPTPLQLGQSLTELRTVLSAFLRTLPAVPRLLALGEPTHRPSAFPEWRNRIFRVLAEDHGFRSVALESDITRGLRVNAHVTSGRGTPGEVMATGFSHGLGAVEANRALVGWMRDFNAGRDPKDHLRFYGFDAPLENQWAASPRASLLALHTFLGTHLGEAPVERATLERLCGEDARWTNPAAALDAAQSVGDSVEARQLRLLADDLGLCLQAETPRLAAHPGFWEACLHARTAAGLLRYHAVIADPAPTRVARMLALRDLLMADHLCAVAGRERERGPTLVFAHNSHLQRPISTMTMRGTRLEWWSAGAQVSERLGQRYAFVAGVLDSSPAPAPAPPAPNTAEGTRPTPGGWATLLGAQDLTVASLSQRAAETKVPLQVDGVLLVGDAAG